MHSLALGAALGIGALLVAGQAAVAQSTPLQALGSQDRLFGRSGGDTVVLVGERTLLFVDLKHSRVVCRVDIKNVGSRVIGIDVRPATRQLYALLASGHLVTVDPATGQATVRSKLSVPFPRGKVSIDFNPAVDRLRIVSDDGTNLRTNVDDGGTIVDTRIAYALPNPFGGSTPGAVAVAYTNGRPGTVPATTLRAVDDPTDALYQVQPANDGVLSPIGRQNVGVGTTVGFDIATDTTGRNIGLVVSGRSIAQIDLAGGAITATAPLAGARNNLRDVAALIH
jgi:hypothetical protein